MARNKSFSEQLFDWFFHVSGNFMIRHFEFFSRKEIPKNNLISVVKFDKTSSDTAVVRNASSPYASGDIFISSCSVSLLLQITTKIFLFSTLNSSPTRQDCTMKSHFKINTYNPTIAILVRQHVVSSVNYKRLPVRRKIINQAQRKPEWKSLKKIQRVDWCDAASGGSRTVRSHVRYRIRNCTDQRYPRMRTFQLRVAPEGDWGGFFSCSRPGSSSREKEDSLDPAKCTEWERQRRRGRKGDEKRKRKENDRKTERGTIKRERECVPGWTWRASITLASQRVRDGKDKSPKRHDAAAFVEATTSRQCSSATPRKPLPASCQWRRGLIRIDGNLSTGKFADEDSDYSSRLLPPDRRRHRRRRRLTATSSRKRREGCQTTTRDICLRPSRIRMCRWLDNFDCSIQFLRLVA